MGVDPTKLPKDLQDKLAAWEKNKPENRQLETLSDLADMTQEVVNVLDAMQNSGVKNATEFGAILVDIREKLSSLDSKEAPETPDTSKPIIDTLLKVEKALTASIKGIDVKPVVNVPKLDAPAVNVTSPDVDLKGIEKILKTDIPKAFKEAIAQMPEEKADIDYTEKFDAMLEQLDSIDTASRMKPQFPVSQLNSIKTAIENVSTIASNLYATKIDTTTTVGVIYIGKAAIGSSSASAVWQIKKLDTNTLALDKKWADSGAFTQIWDNRATTVTYS